MLSFRPVRLPLALVLTVTFALLSSSARAQDGDSCTVFCAPDVEFEPTVAVESIDENPVELEAELNIALLTPQETGGWLDAHVDVVDQLRPPEQLGDTRLDTHKLNLELDVAVLPFPRLEHAGYLRHVGLEGALDYLATGLPLKGDTFGQERFLEHASPWGLSAVLILPIAPLDR